MTLKRYETFRKAQRNLHKKILDTCVSTKEFNQVNELIGVVKNTEIILWSEMERAMIFDFNIYERYKNGQNAVTEYIAREEKTSPEEKELLAAMVHAKSGLYRVVEVDPETYTILLKNVEGESSELITLIDYQFSQGLEKDVLLFTRIMNLGDFYMTSGLAFIFRENHKDYLLRRSKKAMKKVESGDEAIDRFIAYFYLNRSDGLSLLLQNGNA